MNVKPYRRPLCTLIRREPGRAFYEHAGRSFAYRKERRRRRWQRRRARLRG